MVLFIFACFKTDVPPQEEGKIPEVVGEASSEYGSTDGATGSDSSGATSGGDSSGGTTGGDSSGTTSGGDSSGGTTGSSTGGDSSGGTTGGSTGGTTDGGGGDDVSQICDDSFSYDLIIPEGECYSQMISCGDVITTTTNTGTSYYNVDHYNAWQNDPMRGSDYEGLEHAFYFYHPGSASGYDYTRAEITVETPCTDMDLLYFLTPDGSPSCYNEYSYSSILYSNGASANNGIQSETVLIDDNNPNLYYVIVESRNGVPSAFRLTVTCN